MTNTTKERDLLSSEYSRENRDRGYPGAARGLGSRVGEKARAGGSGHLRTAGADLPSDRCEVVPGLPRTSDVGEGGLSGASVQAS